MLSEGLAPPAEAALCTAVLLQTDVKGSAMGPQTRASDVSWGLRKVAAAPKGNPNQGHRADARVAGLTRSLLLPQRQLRRPHGAPSPGALGMCKGPAVLGVARTSPGPTVLPQMDTQTMCLHTSLHGSPAAGTARPPRQVTARPRRLGGALASQRSGCAVSVLTAQLVLSLETREPVGGHVHLEPPLLVPTYWVSDQLRGAAKEAARSPQTSSLRTEGLRRPCGGTGPKSATGKKAGGAGERPTVTQQRGHVAGTGTTKLSGQWARQRLWPPERGRRQHPQCQEARLSPEDGGRRTCCVRTLLHGL